jgi:hypothetical protein
MGGKYKKGIKSTRKWYGYNRLRVEIQRLRQGALLAIRRNTELVVGGGAVGYKMKYRKYATEVAVGCHKKMQVKGRCFLFYKGKFMGEQQKQVERSVSWKRKV